MSGIGIREIATFIPAGRVSNLDKKDLFSIDNNFIEKKIGVRETAVKDPGDEVSDMCVKAYERLLEKCPDMVRDVDVLVVVTQTPDIRIPHSSAIVHGKLGLDERCACFDISLGCSGFVYGLNIVKSFMRENGFNKGLLFTADAYSKITDAGDKNTSLLFGDASTVTLIADHPLYVVGKTTFGTVGRDYMKLSCVDDKLQMDGRAVLNFIMRYVPDDILALLEKSRINVYDVDRFVFHQGSRFIIDMLTKSLKLNSSKVIYDIYGYGNTVSSSIPIILEKEIADMENRKILISGFGTGLSWSSGILERT